MSLGSTIFSLLNGTTECGSNVFPMERPQETLLPALTYGIISTIPVKQKTTTADLQQIRVQISIYSNSYAQIETIASQVRSQLDIGGMYNQNNIQTTTFDGERDDYIQNADYGGIFAKYQDYIMFVER